MKKLLLLSILLSISLLIFSQTPKKLEVARKINNHKFNQGLNYIDKENHSQFVGAKQKNVYQKKAESQKKDTANLNEINKYYIGSSANVYTLLVPTSTCLTDNQNLNTIMFTYRDNPVDMHFASTVVGNILSSYSTDGGVDWKLIDITGGRNAAPQNRYPSGVIYNPPNNTTPNLSYSVIGGPTTNGTTWTFNYFGSSRLDSSNINVQYVPITTSPYEYFPRSGMTATDDGKIHLLGYGYLYEATDTLFHQGIVNNATFDSTNKKFNWTLAGIVQTFYSRHDTEYWNTINEAWSQDGSIGYVYFIGVDSINAIQEYSEMPIVYQSLDSGNTWTLLPPYDFSQLTDITTKIWPTDSGVSTLPHIKIPSFSGENDGVVDANGNLHIFSLINGSAKSNDPDSIGWYFLREPLKLFDVLYTNSTGAWSARLIDTLKSRDVPADSSGFGTAADKNQVGWDHRIQTSRTVDGKKIFATWTDTDILYYGGADDVYPDLIGYGEDVITGLRTDITDFTGNINNIQGSIKWNYTGDLTITDGNKYRIPVTTSNTTANPDDSVAHYFLTGIYFTDNDFVSNPGVKVISGNNFTVSQNYPNPYTNLTSVNVTLSKPSSVKLEVRNLLGQKVYEIPQQNLSAGKHIFTIKSTLDSGIYFYTVTVGENSVSKKMIVK